MSEDGWKALETQLGAAPPPGLSGLRADQLQHLAEAVREARHRQTAELGAASDQALEHIPRLLRPPIRKLFG